MSLEEFDELIDRMMLALEYAENLGQYVDAARILYQMNGELPGDLQLALEDLEDAGEAKSFLARYKPGVRHAVSDYRQRLDA